MERTLEQALNNAGRISAELPELIQPEPEAYDMVLLASEVCRLREKLKHAAMTIQLASECVEDWGQYADEHCQKRHDLKRDVREFKEYGDKLMSEFGA